MSSQASTFLASWRRESRASGTAHTSPLLNVRADDPCSFVATSTKERIALIGRMIWREHDERQTCSVGDLTTLVREVNPIDDAFLRRTPSAPRRGYARRGARTGRLIVKRT